MRNTLIYLYILISTPLTLLSNENNHYNSNRIAVIVNRYLSEEISHNINTYFEDLQNEGYEPILKEWSLEQNPSPSELKSYLKKLYENGGLQGAVFIGDLPIAIMQIDKFESHVMHYLHECLGEIIGYDAMQFIGKHIGLFSSEHIGPFPTDHYYMDLENDDWKDNDGNGYIDQPIFTKDNIGKRAIWVSRLTPVKTSLSAHIMHGMSIMREVEQIKNYFRKNHEFRTGKKLYTERNWNYITTEFLNYHKESIHYFYNSNNQLISLNKVTDFFLGDLEKSAFIKLLTEDSNEIGVFDLHGTYSKITINKPSNIIKDWLCSNEISYLNIQTAFLFPVSCWIGNYSVQDYFAGSLLFTNDSGVQAIISSTIPMQSWSINLFLYRFEEGANLGESYLKYLSEEDCWYYELRVDEMGRVLLGDGTLKRQRYLIAKDKVKSGKDEIRSSELRSKLSPGSILPVINTLRFYIAENTIFWSKYYNERDLSYRLEKENADGSKTLIYEGKDNQAIDYDIKSSDVYYLTYVWNDVESRSNSISVKDSIGIDSAISKRDVKLEKYLLESMEENEQGIARKLILVTPIKESLYGKIDCF